MSMFYPNVWCGPKDQVPDIPAYNWLGQIKSSAKIYLVLGHNWHQKASLPDGYDFYFVSYHIEAVNLDWLLQQVGQVTGTIVCLYDGEPMPSDHKRLIFLPFFYWHVQTDLMLEWFGNPVSHERTYKFSTVCNRITQSKMWITTKLLEVAADESLIILGNWVEDKNVHNWQLTGNTVLDQLTTKFQEKYLGKELRLDDFSKTQTDHSSSGNPWKPWYTDAVVHFSNESFHYSYMIVDDKEFIYPGPYITEKTLKCLVAGTALVPAGQYHIYKILENLGFQFDYEFNRHWDNDAGNLSRFQQIVQLIDDLKDINLKDLNSCVHKSSLHNQNHILSGNFYKVCESKNQSSLQFLNSII